MMKIIFKFNRHSHTKYDVRKIKANINFIDESLDIVNRLKSEFITLEDNPFVRLNKYYTPTRLNNKL